MTGCCAAYNGCCVVVGSCVCVGSKVTGRLTYVSLVSYACAVADKVGKYLVVCGASDGTAGVWSNCRGDLYDSTVSYGKTGVVKFSGCYECVAPDDDYNRLPPTDVAGYATKT